MLRDAEGSRDNQPVEIHLLIPVRTDTTFMIIFIHMQRFTLSGGA